MSEQDSRETLKRLLAEKDEELRRLRSILGLHDIAISNDASKHDDPLLRFYSTALQIGVEVAWNACRPEIERLMSKVAELEANGNSKPKRAAHRPRLRRKHEPPDPSSMGLGRFIGTPRERSKGEIRLDFVEDLEAELGSAISDREAISILVERAQSLEPLTDDDPVWKHHLRNAFARGGTPESLAKSISEARRERRLRTSE